jgi:hypothetical protein
VITGEQMRGAAKWVAFFLGIGVVSNPQEIGAWLRGFRPAPTVVEADACCADTLLVPIVSDLRQQMDKLIAMSIRTQIMLADMPQHEKRRGQFRIIDSLRQEEKRIRLELEDRQGRAKPDKSSAIVGRSVRHPDRL